jgi:hypothetical protein
VNEAQPRRKPARRPTRRAKDVPVQEAAELKRRYDAGETLLELLENFDGGYGVLRTVLKAQGVQFRPAQPVTPPAPPGMVATYTSGTSIVETGELFGVSRDVARRMLLAAGVKLRPRGRPVRSDDDVDPEKIIP